LSSKKVVDRAWYEAVGTNGIKLMMMRGEVAGNEAPIGRAAAWREEVVWVGPGEGRAAEWKGAKAGGRSQVPPLLALPPTRLSTVSESFVIVEYEIRYLFELYEREIWSELGGVSWGKLTSANVCKTDFEVLRITD